MKLKKLLKQGKKQVKKEQVKQEVVQQTKVDDDEQQRDESLIDIKQDVKRKQQAKPKVSKRVETNKLDEVEIDTSKYVIEKKQEVKQKPTTWVVEADKVKDLLKEDFKLHEVDHEFESLTDTKLNQQLKQKKQKLIVQQKHQAIGQMKFAPLGSDPLESRTTDKLTLGKPKTETGSFIGFSTGPALNFTNTKLGGGNINVAPLQKPAVQLYEDDIEKKARERLEQTKKEQVKVGWARKGPTTTQAPKQTPKIQFKSSPMTFTNSAMNFTNSAMQTKTQEQQFKGFQPIQKSKQEQVYERKQQQFKFVNKKQQQERRKKRQQQAVKLQAPIQTQPKA